MTEPLCAALDNVRTIEECALNAWPALQTLVRDGWLFRLSDGFTKRANSANALAPTAAFSPIRAAAEELYRRNRLPVVFRLTPLANPEADLELAQAGYAARDPTSVLTLDLSDTPATAEHVSLVERPSPAWRAGAAAAASLSAGDRAIHDRLIQAIAAETAFATVLDTAGRNVGYGLAVRERGWVGLFDLVVEPAARGGGAGKRLVAALLAWGREGGAAAAYLQVSADNMPARALYARLGFREAYGYHYRVL